MNTASGDFAAGIGIARHAGFAALLFDLDGTLLDTVPDLAAASNRMLAALERSGVTEATVATYVGAGVARLVERVLRGGGGGALDDGLRQRAQGLFETFYAEESGRRSRPYPGVAESLQRLRDGGVPMGVVTNKPAAFTVPLLEHTRLAPFFGVVVSGDTLPWKKPDPRPLLHACATLGAAPAKALFVGDSHHDIETARAAGCTVWCVPYGYNEGRPLRAGDCDRLVADVAEAAARVLAMPRPAVSPGSARGS